MKQLTTKLASTGLHIEDYPDAEKVVLLESPTAQILRSIALHAEDLACCATALRAIQIEETGSGHENVVAEGLWYAAVVRYFVCFKKAKARQHLDKSAVFQAMPEALAVFDYFENLRDKHLVHDENPYTQVFVGVVINKPNAPDMVADVVSGVVRGVTVDRFHLSQFCQLVDWTLQWVKSERERLHFTLAAECRLTPRNVLLRLPAPEFAAPTAAQIATTRKR